MKVILNRDIRKLGKVGDVVIVKDGYGRNFLLPRGYVSVATKENIAKLQEKIEELKVKNENLIKEAKKVADIISTNVYNIVRQASDDDIIYGSVRTKDVYNFICSLLQQNGIEFPLEIGGINIANPIKTLGQHIVSVEIFGDIVSNIRINVCRTNADFEQDVDKFDKKREKALTLDKDTKTKQKDTEKNLSTQVNNTNTNQQDNDESAIVTSETDNKNSNIVNGGKSDDDEENEKLSISEKKENTINTKSSGEEEKVETKTKKSSKTATNARTKKSKK